MHLTNGCTECLQELQARGSTLWSEVVSARPTAAWGMQPDVRFLPFGAEASITWDSEAADSILHISCVVYFLPSLLLLPVHLLSLSCSLSPLSLPLLPLHSQHHPVSACLSVSSHLTCTIYTIYTSLAKLK